MEIQSVPAKDKVTFDQDEVRQTRDISGKLSGMARALDVMVRGGELSKDELDAMIKELTENKHDVDKYFTDLMTAYDSLK